MQSWISGLQPLWDCKRRRVKQEAKFSLFSQMKETLHENKQIKSQTQKASLIIAKFVHKSEKVNSN